MSGEPSQSMTSGPLDAAAVEAVQKAPSVASILEVCCRVTGMGFAAVARVTPEEWTACAVLDRIGFGLEPGGQLPVDTTLCHEVRQSRQVVVFDDAQADPDWRVHHTPQLYGLRSYISVPIVTADGEFFGTLCAIDPQPHEVSRPETVAMFQLFAQLIAAQVEADESLSRSRAGQREAEDRLALSQAALIDQQAVSDLRDQFIAVLGHDLRNPLAAIDAGLTLLEREAAAEGRTRRVLGDMKAASGRMSRLIADVLDFARGRLGGGLPVGLRSAVDLGPVLAAVADELRAAHPDRRILLDVTLARAVACDPGRVAQLLSNLMANAVAHGEGDIRVGGGSDADGVVLWVANGGRPIPHQDRARLFEPFRRQASSGGLGLGLYIASQIAQAHGGRLDLESDAAETRFTFRMPLVPDLAAVADPT